MQIVLFLKILKDYVSFYYKVLRVHETHEPTKEITVFYFICYFQWLFQAMDLSL